MEERELVEVFGLEALDFGEVEVTKTSLVAVMTVRSQTLFSLY